MRIGINLTSLVPGKIGGMEQYIHNLLSHIKHIAEGNEWYLFLSSYNYDAFEAGGTTHKILVPDLENLYEWYCHWILWLRLDVWFCPLATLIPPNVPIPSVVNIPDIQHEFYPQLFEPGVLSKRLEHYQSSAQLCHAVVTLSEFSQKTIMESYRLPPHKVHGIHLDAAREFLGPSSEALNQAVREKYQLADGYGFYPANTWHHKNHLNLLKALLLLRQRDNLRVHMVFTGSPQEAHWVITRFIEDNNLGDQVKWLGYVPQEEMPYLYRNAGFLCFPSLFEGFGIPLVEAMRSRLPIVCSDAGSIPEVVGAAALLFNPHLPQEIAEKIALVQRPDIRMELIAKGAAQANLFSWEKCARQTWDVFLSVVKPARDS